MSTTPTEPEMTDEEAKEFLEVFGDSGKFKSESERIKKERPKFKDPEDSLDLLDESQFKS